MFSIVMDSLRKWFYKPRRDDTSHLAQFFYADEALNLVAAELDSFDGRKDPERCTMLVNHLRHCQDKVLNICNRIMDEMIPNERADRDFRVKFPDDVMQDNLAGQLWFGAECLAAGSSIMNRETESGAMRPLAKALTKALENVRNLLREAALRSHSTPPTEIQTDKLTESLKVFDRLLADFELAYVSAMVPVKTVQEYELQQCVVVLFSETLHRALKMALLNQEMVDQYDPALMFTIPRLAIVTGLLIYPHGPLSLGPCQPISDMFRPFKTLLLKIRELLWTLTEDELLTLEKMLCSAQEPVLPHERSNSPCENRMTAEDGETIDHEDWRRNDSEIKEVSVEVERPMGESCQNVENDVDNEEEEEEMYCEETPTTNELNHMHHHHHHHHHHRRNSHTNNRCTSQTTTTNTSTIISNNGTSIIARAGVGELTEDHSPHDSGFAQSNSDNSLSDSGVGGQPGVITDPPSTSETADNNTWRLQVIPCQCSTCPGIGRANDDCVCSLVSVNECTDKPATTTTDFNINNNLMSNVQLKKSIGDNSKVLLNGLVSSVRESFTATVQRVGANVVGSGVGVGNDSGRVDDIIDHEEEEDEEVDDEDDDDDDDEDAEEDDEEHDYSGNLSERMGCGECSLGRRYAHNWDHLAVMQRANDHLEGDAVASSYSSSCSSCHSPISNCASSDTSSYNSDCQDDIEVALAMRAAELRTSQEARAKFRSSDDLVHRLFVCIAGVADQLQTNFAGDLRNILKAVFLINATDRADYETVDDDNNECCERGEDAVEWGEREHEAAPSWVPDQAAPACMSCMAPFNVVRRRHHCRNCGKVFCARCSSNSVPLPRYGHVKPVRVCNRCFIYQVTPFTLDANVATAH